MKRFFAFMMALAMLFSMSVNAFATEDKGSITVTNATVGDTYYLYKIFDAAFAVGEDGKPVVNNDKVLVSYTIEEDNQFFSYMFSEENAYFSYNANTGAVTRKEGTSDSAITDYLKEMVQDETKGYTPVTDPIEAVEEDMLCHCMCACRICHIFSLAGIFLSNVYFPHSDMERVFQLVVLRYGAGTWRVVVPAYLCLDIGRAMDTLTQGECKIYPLSPFPADCQSCVGQIPLPLPI